MKLSLIASILSFACATDMHKQFYDYLKHYNISFNTPEEVEEKYQNFVRNMETIQKLNQQDGGASYGPNQFILESEDEFQKHHLGFGTHHPSLKETQLFEEEFKAWMAQYNLNYTGDEYHQRLAIFSENFLRAMANNQQDGTTSYMVMNQFAAYTHEEWAAMMGFGTNHSLMESQYAHLFSEWMNKFGFEYQGAEYTKRLAIFTENLKKIEELNKQDGGSTSDLNQFSAMTREEFEKDHLGFGTGHGLQAREFEAEFNAWKAKHNKTYATPEEEETRYDNFAKNVKMIMHHNSTDGTSYTMGLNDLSDLSHEEYLERLGFKPKNSGNGFLQN